MVVNNRSSLPLYDLLAHLFSQGSAHILSGRMRGRQTGRPPSTSQVLPRFVYCEGSRPTRLMTGQNRMAHKA